jgi:hypothetical protein
MVSEAELRRRIEKVESIVGLPEDQCVSTLFMWNLIRYDLMAKIPGNPKGRWIRTLSYEEAKRLDPRIRSYEELYEETFGKKPSAEHLAWMKRKTEYLTAGVFNHTPTESVSFEPGN